MSRFCIRFLGIAFLGLCFLSPPCLGQSTDNLSPEQQVLKLKEQIIDIQNNGVLGIGNFTLCSNILGYGQYVPASSAKVKQNATIYFYYEPVNLFTNRLKGAYQIRFTQDIVLKSEAGEILLEVPEAVQFNLQTFSPVLDTYATNELDLSGAPLGVYVYEAILHDKLKNAKAVATLTFEIIP